MKRYTLRFHALTLTVSIVFCSSARLAAQTIDPRDLLVEASRAVSDLQKASFNVVMEFAGGQGPRHLEGRIIFERLSKKSAPFKLRLEYPDGRVCSYDGKDTWTRNAGTKSARRSSGAARATRDSLFAPFTIGVLFDEMAQRIVADGSMIVLTYAGTETIGGAECHVIEAQPQGESPWGNNPALLYIGVDDRLCHGIVIDPLANDGMGTGRMIFTDYDLNPTVTAATFKGSAASR